MFGRKFAVSRVLGLPLWIGLLDGSLWSYVRTFIKSIYLPDPRVKTLNVDAYLGMQCFKMNSKISSRPIHRKLEMIERFEKFESRIFTDL